MRRALVTGAAGFIGSHVVDNLLKDHSVVAVDNLSGGRLDNLDDERVEWVPGNIASETFVDMVFDELGPFDYVYHLGAYAAEGLSHFIRGFNYETNLMASMNLINKSILTKVKQFIFTSSIAVYGSMLPPFDETFHPEPEDPYGISKYAVELDLQAAQKQFGMSYTIFRPHNVYGPRQNISDPYRNVIGIFMRQCMQGEPMTIFGDGKQQRAFTYITDVAPYIARAPFRRGTDRVFNIGSDDAYSVLDVAQMVAEVVGVECCVKFLPARNEVFAAHSTHARIRSAFADMPRPVKLRTGLSIMYEWVKKNGIPEPTTFRGKIEVPINMPPSWNVEATVSHNN